MRTLLHRVLAFGGLTLLIASCGGGANQTPLPLAPNDPRSTSSSAHITQAINAAPAYVASRLPANFVPSAMMRSGRIAGALGADGGIYYHGTITDLGRYPGEKSSARFVNSFGVAVGSSSGTQPGSRALLFSNHRVLDLGRLPSGPNGAYINNSATVISDTGAIYGNSDFNNDLGPPPIVFFAPNQTPKLVNPPSSQLTASGFVADINRTGEFTYVRSFGDAPFSPLGAVGFHLFTTFVFGQRGSGATALNDRGDVAGYIDPVNEPYFALPGYVTNWKAFLRTKTSLTLLPYLPGSDEMEAMGLNNNDELVGVVGLQWFDILRLSAPARIFFYSNGKLYDGATLLSSLLSPPVSLLPGLADDGSFVVKKNNVYYLVHRP